MPKGELVKSIWASMATGFAYVLTALVGMVLAAASILWYFVPKREKARRDAEQQEADRRAAAIKAEIQKAHEARAQAVEVKVAEVKDRADAQKAQDSVALANALLKEE